MVLFFFVVGLEIARELRAGELVDRRRIALPSAAAVGGMMMPALVYLAFNTSGTASRGWGIPMATDIAFAVGVLAVMGDRIPDGLRIFLLSLAIVDDIGAVAVIAIFYSQGVEAAWGVAAIAAIAGYAIAARSRRRIPGRGLLLIALALAAWYATIRTGVHPTVAGVALGLLSPVGAGPRDTFARLELPLHTVTSYAIVPVFALANAGVRLDVGSVRDAFASPIFWGVAVGLVAGKIAGIAVPTVVALRTGFGGLPGHVGTRDVFGVAALGGIGFTVALFITSLAFTDAGQLSAARTGVLFGSVAGATLGAALLWPQARHPSRSKSTTERPRST
jgi:NhaA family Na+:H+ antiporter